MEYLIRPVRGHGDPDVVTGIQIDAEGDATLTEALDFALRIIATVRDYGKIEVVERG